MKATDYIIQFLINKGTTDFFGYPGGVVCHLMDSATKYDDELSLHITYHEQAAAFAACGYAQSSGKLGAAYATSGPGATNLITGIANAYFDSLPVIFFTGQVDTYAGKKDLGIRQCGFQETDIVTITSAITKYAVYVEDADKLPEYLETAYSMAMEGRPGPVLLDLPADVQRADVSQDIIDACVIQRQRLLLECSEKQYDEELNTVMAEINKAKRPCLLVGAGVLQSVTISWMRQLASKLNIPIVTSMNAMSALPFSDQCQFGFIGANGHRCANIIMAKSDLIVSIGARLDLKQVGNNRAAFLPNVKLLRLDIDQNELAYKVRADEHSICVDLRYFLPLMVEKCQLDTTRSSWLEYCQELKRKLYDFDFDIYHKLISTISDAVPEGRQIVTDCGQSQVWTMQAFKVKLNQQLLTTGGLGTMGYSLPASIGAHYATGMPVVGFAGDGGFQMNIQELQFIKRENLPIKMVILNNNALGMIRQFQEINFNENYINTTRGSGYTVPNFKCISEAYGIKHTLVVQIEDIEQIDWQDNCPEVVEVMLPEVTSLLPRFGKVNGFIDAEPLIPEVLMTEIERV